MGNYRKLQITNWQIADSIICKSPICYLQPKRTIQVALFFYLLITFFSTCLHSQGLVRSISYDSLDLQQYVPYSTHSAIQPLNRINSAPHLRNDSVVKNWFQIRLSPDFAGQLDTSLFYRAAVGFSIETALNDKFYARASVSSGWSTREGINQTHTAYLPLHTNDSYIYTDVRARLCYTPNELLHVAVGIDNQFFGEGYRSLIQSDQVAPTPFGLMRVNAWRLEYGLLYQFLNENDSLNRIWKFTATHYLSYNITNRWNATLFETVLFQPSDGKFKRGFEVEYLNPIVFFRPQEYSIGSSDNVLLGLQTAYSLNRSKIYAQVSLDEFVLKEIRAKSRWWANKYGVQLGVKGKIGKKTSYRVEGNFVRPYTYAHINNGQNAGNLGRALGHPLGSNFAECLVEIRSVTKWFNWKSYAVFQLRGLDEDSISWGGDIYQTYTNRPMEYNHTIGQGITVRSVRVGVEISKSFPKMNGKVYFDPQCAVQWGEVSTRFYPALTIGFRSQLFQDRKGF